MIYNAYFIGVKINSLHFSEKESLKGKLRIFYSKYSPLKIAPSCHSVVKEFMFHISY